jgi:hypothetical protein
MGQEMRFLKLIVLAIGLAACAQPSAWYKNGATQADFNRDAFDCEKTTRQVAYSFGGGLGGAMEADDFASRCMVARGWVKGPA